MMRLQFLANETLLVLFDYMSIIEIFRSFARLNRRFDAVIFAYLQANFHFDLQSVYMYDLIAICRLYLPKKVNKILSLCFSHEERLPLEIKLSFNCQWSKIQSLTFHHVFSSAEMTAIMSKSSHCPGLISLNLIECSFDFDGSIMNQIWSLSKLKQLYMSSLICCRDVSLNLSTCSLTIQSISIEQIYLKKNSLNSLFQFTSELQRLSILTEKNDKYFDITHLPYVTKLRLIESDEAPADRLFKDDRLVNLLQSMPNLSYLSVDIPNMLLDGYQWQHYITSYMPKLKVFRYKMEKLFHRLQKIDTVVDHLLRSFQTKFWTETHHWFIRCHCNARGSYDDRILYYTIPYLFRQLIFVNDYLWSQSTSPYDHIKDNSMITDSPVRQAISSFEKIYQLFRLTPTLAYSCPKPCSTAVYELTVDRAFHRYFSKFIGNLDQLNSLNLLLYSMGSGIDESQLQLLLNLASNLSTLSIIQYTDAFPGFILKNLKSKSIYQLNLRKVNHSYPSIAYDMDKCTELVLSFLGKQCEILTIRVTNQSCIVYLIENLINLRLLKVFCQDYHFDRLIQNEYERTLLSLDYDRLIQWLYVRLPRTIHIERYQFPNDTVHIWIPERFHH